MRLRFPLLSVFIHLYKRKVFVGPLVQCAIAFQLEYVFGIGHDLLVIPPLHVPICSTSLLSSAGPVIASFFYFTPFTHFVRFWLCFVVFWLASFSLPLGDWRYSHKLPPWFGAVLRLATDSARVTPLLANGRRPKRSFRLLSGSAPPAKTLAVPRYGPKLRRARGTI